MVMLDEALARTLAKSRVRIDQVDADTVRLRGVPANPQFFNKGRTNILIKRPGEGM